MKQDYRKRFWSKVKLSGFDDCWLWTASISKNGYGSFGLNGKMILHTCDVRACCNPRHLYLGDVKQNTKDMMDRGGTGPPQMTAPTMATPN